VDRSILSNHRKLLEVNLRPEKDPSPKMNLVSLLIYQKFKIATLWLVQERPRNVNHNKTLKLLILHKIPSLKMRLKSKLTLSPLLKPKLSVLQQQLLLPRTNLISPTKQQPIPSDRVINPTYTSLHSSRSLPVPTLNNAQLQPQHVAVIPPNNNNHQQQPNRSRKSQVNKRNLLPQTRALSSLVRDKLIQMITKRMKDTREERKMLLHNGKMGRILMVTMKKELMRRLPLIYLHQTTTIIITSNPHHLIWSKSTKKR
jgi:hypothetical protein